MDLNVTENFAPTFEPSAARKHFLKTWLVYALLTVLHTASALLAVKLILPLLPTEIFEKYYYELNYIGNLLPFYLIIIPFCAFLLKFLPKKVPEKNSLGKKNYFFIILIGVFFAYAGNFIGTTLSALISVFTGEMPSTASDIIHGNFFVSLLFVGILAPIFEELIFRKVLIDHTLKYGEGVAVLMSGLIFGIIHGNFQQIFFAAGLGFIFALIYCRTGNIFMTIIPHMIINSTSTTLSYFVLPKVTELTDLLTDLEEIADLDALLPELLGALPALLVLLLYVVLLMGAAIAGLVFFIIKIRKFKFRPSELTVAGNDGSVRPLTLSDTARYIFLNPGFLVFAAISAFEIIDSIFRIL